MNKSAMSMVRNESIARMMMLLCFGTAILFLIVHWRIRTEAEQSNKSISTASRHNTHPAYSTEDPKATIYTHKSSIGIGETLLGATLPTFPTFFSHLKPHGRLVRKNPSFRSNDLIAPGTDNTSNVFNSSPDSPESASDQTQTQLVVHLGDRRVYVYRHNQVIASYPIAVGKKGWETPMGDFRITHMEKHPIWRHPITGKVFEPGSTSPLGERWIGFWSDGRNEIGFHGTPNIDLVGTAVSHGCLRMRNSDVRMLYSQVTLGTIVEVRN
jgi:lipoprotein-anchoring transpeptidase ErfK/SrfK